MGAASPNFFTGKERDSESGLDNFGARYDSSSMGRFMSPDPENAGASEDDSQSWNAYAHVMNNPLNSIDPDGRADCPEKLLVGTAQYELPRSFAAATSGRSFGVPRTNVAKDF